MKSVIQTNDLHVHFNVRGSFIQEIFSNLQKKVKAVDGVDIQIGEGEIFSLVGESGSGKTTVGKALLALEQKTSGSILFNGEEIPSGTGKNSRPFRQKAQMIFQDPYQSLNPREIVLDIVGEPLVVNNLVKTSAEKRERVIEALGRAGLRPQEEYLYRRPHELSGGQRQRVAIAAALVLNPRFIVADEPVSMLDVSIRADILRLMVEMRDKLGISYLFITHDLSLAWLISDRIAIMYLGKIMEIGSSGLIVGSSMHPYTQALINVMPVPRVTKNKKRLILKGETPDPIDLPAGCRFNPRCPVAQEICRRVEPELAEVAPGHHVACHFPRKSLAGAQ